MRQYLPSEKHMMKDETTNRNIQVITDHPSINHHPFFLIQAYDDAMHYLYLVSNRTGSPQVYAYDRIYDQLIRLSNVGELNEWSVHPSRNGRFVYYIADGSAMRVDVESGEEQILLSPMEASAICGGSGLINPGKTNLTPGTTALSADDRYWAIRIVDDDIYTVLLYDSLNDDWRSIYSSQMVSHMQFCPDDSNLLFCAGPLTDRVWILDCSSKTAKRFFRRDKERKQWITHESWIPGTREISLVDWPHGVLAVNVDTSNVRRLTSFNAWHSIANRTGDLMVADTNFPDIGLQLFDPRDSRDSHILLCCPGASSLGAHWNEPFPYEHGPIKTYAPQHTHPHPSFSPDGRTVVFTTDKSGHAQVCEIDVPEDIYNRI